MAKNLASVKPVKCYGEIDERKLAPDAFENPVPPNFVTPCTLLTTARYKKLMDVVKAAQADKKAGDAVDANPKGQAEWKEYERRIAELNAAIEAAEKAGILKNT